MCSLAEKKVLGCPHIGGHHKAQNWGCSGTVDTNGLTLVCFNLLFSITLANVNRVRQRFFSCIRNLYKIVQKQQNCTKTTTKT